MRRGGETGPPIICSVIYSVIYIVILSVIYPVIYSERQSVGLYYYL